MADIVLTAADRKKITEELESLQLEELLEKRLEAKSRRERRARRARMIEMQLAKNREQQKALQAICKHKKGGKGVEGMHNGNDANYALITHTLSHGPTVVICQRCGKLWEPPDPALIRKGASSDERKEYKRLYDEYQVARNLPTDNTPSGTQIFLITGSNAAA